MNTVSVKSPFCGLNIIQSTILIFLYLCCNRCWKNCSVKGVNFITERSHNLGFSISFDRKISTSKINPAHGYRIFKKSYRNKKYSWHIWWNLHISNQCLLTLSQVWEKLSSCSVRVNRWIALELFAWTFDKYTYDGLFSKGSSCVMKSGCISEIQI